ncbi:MAG: ATP-binding protein [Gammaproteobacteria bacterium]|nr:ATP-binding protein [Gammaproteobacteria bacterium]
MKTPIEDLTKNDLTELVKQRVRENEIIEFKGQLPTKKGKSDPWLENQSRIGDYAKARLAEETVAFANKDKDGGILLVGIEESESVAHSIQPLPKCEKLADRIAAIFSDLIEPAIPKLEIVGIETDGEAGVLVIRVEKSTLAPHRVTSNNRFMIRRRDRCEELSVLELQNRLRNGSPTTNRVAEKLQERHEKFLAEFDSLSTPNQAFGVRVTGVPVIDQRFVDNLFDDDNINANFTPAPIPECVRAWGNLLQGLYGNFQNRYRGAREDTIRSQETVDRFSYCEVSEYGLLEFGFLCSSEFYTSSDSKIEPVWLVNMFGQMLTWVNKYREALKQYELIYEVEVEIVPRDTPLRLGTNDEIQRGFDEDHEKMNGIDSRLRHFAFPTYSFGKNDSIELLVQEFHKDLMNKHELHP